MKRSIKPIILFLIFFANTLFADEYNSLYFQSTYGGIGLIEVPSARFLDDGEFVFGSSYEDVYRRLYASVQIFPWMEATVKYTEGTSRPYMKGSKQTWKDKGLDFRFLLSKESEILPQIAIGITDFGGTGAYASEYIVASKSLNNLDFSLGLGWGRLAGENSFSNPIGYLIESKKERGGEKGSLGGRVSFGRLFSGDAAVFAGLEYKLPIENLTLKLEYDTSDYTRIIGLEKKFDQAGDKFELDSRINYALNYRINLGDRDKADFSLGYVRGNTVYLNAAVHSNLNFKGIPSVILGPEKLRNSSIESYQTTSNNWKKFLTDRIIWEMGNIGFVTHEIFFNGDELAAEISQGRFLETASALDLASRVLANNAPRNIEKITVINLDQGIETLRSTIKISDIKNTVIRRPLTDDMFAYNEIKPLQNDSSVIKNEYLYPNFSWQLKPQMLGTLQHQQKFYFWQLQALLHTEYAIKKGLYLTGDIGINIANNYDDYSYHVPDGELHHVRQDRRLYLTEGESGLRRLALDYVFGITPNIKAKLSAGYLEWMYGGLGGEVLYYPNDKRWALGLETYWVKQRDFNQRFGFQEYETVTGFLTYYQDIPFYDLRLKLSMGKFLGKDVGAHVDFSRRFKTGARVGAIVALTDCDSQCVGEGSFNKWIYFELPMDLFYIQSSTRQKTGYSWSPLTKDAGTKVDNGGGLYNVVMNATDEVGSLRQRSWSIRKIFSGFGTSPKNSTL